MNAGFETVNSGVLGTYFQHLQEFSTWRWEGSVTKVIGQVVESEGPVCSVGEACEIVDQDGNSFPGEIVGFRGPTVLSMPLDKPSGIRYGDKIYTWGSTPTVSVGDELLGRVVDGSLKPIDNFGPCRPVDSWHLDNSAPSPMDRVPIRQAIGTGIRAIDGFTSCGRGQRIGIFGGSGVGKSTLIGMMTRGTTADLTILALVGERGREVGEFVDLLGPEGRGRSVVVASTSDQSPLLRIRAAMAATALAEYFASRGKNVLLVVDSLTRFAMAQREIGLAAGEPPTAKGYTPSCWNILARLVERAGQFSAGSITAFYSVLMEGDDQQDPLVDAVRSLVDGHLVLDRKLAAQGHYPPIAILDSLSRLMSQIALPEHAKIATEVRRLLASYARSEDLIRVGAYQKGADPVLDKALELLPAINTILQQKKNDRSSFEQTVAALKALPL
jgi:flagellum-specific ATP synthase